MFAAAVIVYVVYGGFRAVVWTDVMQGIIMFLGVVLLLILALRLTGGLEAATRQLAQRRPPKLGQATLQLDSATTDQRSRRGPGFAARIRDCYARPSGSTCRRPRHVRSRDASWN